MTVFDTTGSFAKLLPGEEIDDADLYGRIKLSPESKARADAEWLAMDERGRLPADWVWPPRGPIGPDR
jgi:hypothetical protein